MRRRVEVAEFWDAAIAEWIENGDHRDARLTKWRSSYRGAGRGAIVGSQYPDPFTGDLRGERHPPKIVTLGLNPGVGYEGLQGRDGAWTMRIAERGYSRCLDRIPNADPDLWLQHHKKPSPYWNKLVKFGQRWLDDTSIEAREFLNFELYPWHSLAFTGTFEPDLALTDEFIFQPIREVAVDYVFAFGAPWFAVADKLRLPLMKLFSANELRTDLPGHSGWKVGIYELGSRRLLVSSQPGSASPPGEPRLRHLRELLGKLN